MLSNRPGLQLGMLAPSSPYLYMAVCFSVVWVFVAPLVLAVAANFTSIPDVAASTRDMSIFFGLFVCCFRAELVSRTFSLFFLSAVPFLFYILYSVSIADVPLFAALATSRQVITPIAILALFILAGRDGAIATKFPIWLLKFLAGVAAWGFVERFLHIYGATRIVASYFLNKKIGVMGSGYPFIFIEPSGLSEFSEHPGILRASSTLLDPINFGHAMVAAAALAIFMYQQNKISRAQHIKYIALFLAGAAASLSKGAWIQLAILAIFYEGFLPGKTIRYLIGGVGAFVGAIYVINHPGFAVHLNGLTVAISSAEVTGHGLARAGNYALMLGLREVSAGDTFIGALIGQLGVIGLVTWLLPFVAATVFIVGAHRRFSLPAALLWTQIGVSVMSENAFNLGSVTACLILVGISLQYQDATAKAVRSPSLRAGSVHGRI